MFRVRTFLSSDDGAITVDWVVLTAGIVGLGLASAAAVRTGTSSLGTEIQTGLTGAAVAALGFLGDDDFAWTPRHQWYWDAINATVASRTDESLMRSVEHYAGNWRLGYDPGVYAPDAYAAAYMELIRRGVAIPERNPHPRDL